MKLIRYLLFPFAILYDILTSIRNLLYDKQVFRSVSFDIPIIAVGNLSVGGTGKTPQIEYLIRLLKKEKKVAVLSRGYKRKTKGFVLLQENHTALDVGDEPLQFFNKFSDVPIAVDANRINGIQQLKKLVNPDVVLLDDAFQHRKVKAGFYVLLTRYNDLYVDDFLLPTGNLRESRRGAKRADVFVVTKCPKHLSAIEQQRIREQLGRNKNVFFTAIAYAKSTSGAKEVLTDKLYKYEILLVTGIANSTPLLNFLKERKCKVHYLNFSDHHHFTSQEINRIQQRFNELTAEKKLLLTTEKDYMRLNGRIEDVSYLEIESKFLNKDEQFNLQIQQYCSTGS